MENGLNQNDQNGSISESGSQDGSLSQSQDSSVQDWRETLPAELKSEKSLERFDKGGIPELAKSWVEAQKVISQKGVIVPTEKSPPTEWDNFYKSLGRPDTPDGYKIEKPDLPEGMTWDEEKLRVYAEVAHKTGMSTKQFSDLVALDTEREKTIYDNLVREENEKRERGTTTVKKEFGKDYERKLAEADSAILPFFGEEGRNEIMESGLHLKPSFILGMYKIKQSISEHTLARGEGVVKGTFSREGLNSLMLDKRYSGDRSQRDELYVKQVEQYAADLTAQLGA